MVEKLPELIELSLSKTVDEQEIENLLNEHSDSGYECQNDNKVWTLLNFKVNKVNKFCRFVSLFVGEVLLSTHYTKFFINLWIFIELQFDGNPMDGMRQAWTAMKWDGMGQRNMSHGQTGN